MGIQSHLLSSISGLRHDFGNHAEPWSPTLFPAWESLKPNWKQVHGTRVAEAKKAGENCGETDALFTFESSLPIAVVTADCVPILLARRDGSAVAAVHAGWRGTRARILNELFSVLTQRGESTQNWVAAIGPAIGPCCYEVSEEMALDFLNQFGKSAQPTFRYLDLPAIQAQTLAELGLREVELLRQCTRCTLSEAGAPFYHSYRREGGGTRQYSMIACR